MKKSYCQPDLNDNGINRNTKVDTIHIVYILVFSQIIST